MSEYRTAYERTVFRAEYLLGKVHQLKDSPDLTSEFNVRIAYPPDDSMFVVYIGSDESIRIKERDITSINRSKSSVEFAIEK